jgi:hypothetical protein
VRFAVIILIAAALWAEASNSVPAMPSLTNDDATVADTSSHDDARSGRSTGR